MTSHCLLALALFAAIPDTTVNADNPVPTNPVPTNPVPTNPVPTNPVPTNTVPTNPVPTISQDGSISGVVVNGSQQQQPVPGAKVILQLKSDHEFAWLDETETDSAGRFYFGRLLVSQHLQYKTGTNYGGIHYPGPRVVLTSQQKRVGERIVVRDTVQHPNPLVVRQHVVLVESETGLLRITESMIIENPTNRCYIGPPAAHEEEEPETLQLSIPSDFLKVTFHKEFYGRAFAVKNGHLVTSLPWEPGQRELSFTYVLPNDQKYQVWQRPFDLPTDNLSVRIATAAPDAVTCTVNDQSLARRDETADLVFESQSGPLQKGQVVRIELGHLPISWMVYGRWGAAIVLVIIVVAGVLLRRRRATNSRREAQAKLAPPQADHTPEANARPRQQRNARKRRRAA